MNYDHDNSTSEGDAAHQGNTPLGTSSQPSGPGPRQRPEPGWGLMSWSLLVISPAILVTLDFFLTKLLQNHDARMYFSWLSPLGLFLVIPVAILGSVKVGKLTYQRHSSKVLGWVIGGALFFGFLGLNLALVFAGCVFAVVV